MFLKNHDFFSLLGEFVWSWKTITITKSFFYIFSFFKGNILCLNNYNISLELLNKDTFFEKNEINFGND